MNNKERYYNFIVDDMVKKTKIDVSKSILLSLIPYSIFEEDMKEIYGAKEDEVEVIWDMYIEKMIYLIKKI